MTCWPTARRTFNASCSSSMDWWEFWFLFFAKQCAIGILSCFSMCLLCSATELFVGYKWIDCSNEEFSTSERHEVVLVIRNAQYSIVGVAFWRFTKSCRKAVWEGLFPCCRKYQMYAKEKFQWMSLHTWKCLLQEAIVRSHQEELWATTKWACNFGGESLT